MILLFLIFIFIIYILLKINSNTESFLDRQKSKFKHCNHLTGTLDNIYNVFQNRDNSYRNQKHKTYGIMRPMLFYFWRSKTNIPSKNFKTNKFTFSDVTSNCDSEIIEQLNYLKDKTPYEKLRDNLSNLKLNKKNDGTYLFKSDELHKDDLDGKMTRLDANKYYVFRQNFSDMYGNDLRKDFKFYKNIDSPEMEESDSYHERSANNLRILDIDLDCYERNADTKEKCQSRDPEEYINFLDDTATDCCYLDFSINNNGIKYIPPTEGVSSGQPCCKNTIALSFIPESYLIMKFILHSKNILLENLVYFGYENYNIKNQIITTDSDDDPDIILNRMNEKDIISSCPLFVLWDGFGIRISKDQSNTYRMYIINEDDNLRNEEGVRGGDYLIRFTLDEGTRARIFFSDINNNPIFKNFIKNHFYVYRKNGINFFEYMCLEFKKLTSVRGESYKEEGTDEYIVKDNEITDYGYSLAQELYKYHVKSENDYNPILGNSPLYRDIHIDYYTLTKWYGNNDCKYFKYKKLYEMENINFSWDVCDITKFVLNTLYLPYNILGDDRLGEELINHYYSDFNCKIDIQ
jgi:hypothetical protein